jgi:hypothetical protein
MSLAVGQALHEAVFILFLPMQTAHFAFFYGFFIFFATMHPYVWSVFRL